MRLWGLRGSGCATPQPHRAIALPSQVADTPPRDNLHALGSTTQATHIGELAAQLKGSHACWLSLLRPALEDSRRAEGSKDMLRLSYELHAKLWFFCFQVWIFMGTQIIQITGKQLCLEPHRTFPLLSHLMPASDCLRLRVFFKEWGPIFLVPIIGCIVESLYAWTILEHRGLCLPPSILPNRSFPFLNSTPAILGFQKNRSTFLRVLFIRRMVYWGLYGGFPKLGVPFWGSQ